jgi:hypothetical protein
MPLLSSKNLSKINPLSGKTRWKGVEKNTRKFFKLGKQDSSAKILAKEFQKSRINQSKRAKGYEIVKNMIIEKRITEDKAKGLMNELGYIGSENDRFREFKNVSKYRTKQEKQGNAQTEKQKNSALDSRRPESALDKKPESKPRTAIPSLPSFNNTRVPSSGKTVSPHKETNTSIWQIIDEKKHFGTFSEDDRKDD